MCFSVDLQKAERDYSPTTMYRDYAINRELFHWESQSRRRQRSRPCSATSGMRSKVLTYCSSYVSGSIRTWHAAVHISGPSFYVEHCGERPVAFTWRLASAMPEELFEVARSVAAA